ncbi:DUF4393 domain-containing protein [Flavobacterium sediminilitoris]|uniref:DUF4393 domain-containing protein n=1 Tax=Flavobacterium sediminilitoris TaxID=2024526 RepID=A0ABY4HLJ3_9FLAO|nr:MULTISPECIES: Abi-alpha family protein [Flavobacterium]UOX33531.1 DUF4393 domain-containing protein [Flavobacterium sediminilitoris]
MSSKIDISSTAVEKGIELVQGFLEKLVGATLEETGLLLGDKIRIFRLNNQIKMLVKAQEICKQNNITLKQLSVKALVPLLEYSSLEDNETLQEKWSNLLVNLIDTKENYESSIFPFILNQLSSNELLIIEKIYNYKNENSHLIDYSSIDSNFTNIERINLIRLGLIEMDITSKTNKNKATLLLGGRQFGLSDLGKMFIESCTLHK